LLFLLLFQVAKRRGALRASFEQLDRDGDGFITVGDLAQVLQEGADPSLRGPAGRKKSMDMAALMVHEVDADNDNKVSYAEFRAMWQVPAQ
jgi:calcium-dependent protein kinase